MWVGSRNSDSVFFEREDDDNRNHAPLGKMTLRLFSLLCFDVAYFTSSLSFPDDTHAAFFDAELVLITFFMKRMRTSPLVTRSSR